MQTWVFVILTLMALSVAACKTTGSDGNRDYNSTKPDNPFGNGRGE